MKFKLMEEQDLTGKKVFYRYHDYPSFSLYRGRNVELEVYIGLRETKCGWWVDMGFDDEKWVSNRGKKRFAYPTKEEALQSFIARKSRQAMLLEKQLRGAKEALSIAKEIEKEAKVG